MASVLEAAPAPVLEATPVVPEAPKSDTLLEFEVEGYEPKVSIDLADVEAKARMRLLRTATRAYITNRVSTAVAKTKKDNGPFDTYEAAMKNDPLQTLVEKPEGERAVTDYAGVIDSALKALKSGELGNRGTGEPKPKVLRDPLVTQITRSVVAEVYEKGRAADPKYKYPTAQKEVGQDGLAYLKTKIEAQVAAAPAAEQAAKRTALENYLETRYVKPARIMLGLDTPGKLKDAEGIL
jgi:hypothetical protein